MSKKERFSLSELNQLSEGFGDRIDELTVHHKSFSDFCSAKLEIDKLLSKHKIDEDDVMVKEGISLKEYYTRTFNHFLD